MTLDQFDTLMSIASGFAAIAGVIVALIVYCKNSSDQARQRAVNNATRYLEAHDKVFESNSYFNAVVKDMESGNYKRELDNEELELKFRRLLGDLEHIALLQNAGAVPDTINAYMLGWFCKKVCPFITDTERANPYWELAVDFIDDTKRQAEKLDGYTRAERMKYLKKNHFK